MRMPVDICPNGGVAIQIALPVAVLQPSTLAANEDERCVFLGAPFAHGCEGVPEMRLVDIRQSTRIPNISHVASLYRIETSA